MSWNNRSIFPDNTLIV